MFSTNMTPICNNSCAFVLRCVDNDTAKTRNRAMHCACTTQLLRESTGPVLLRRHPAPDISLWRGNPAPHFALLLQHPVPDFALSPRHPALGTVAVASAPCTSFCTVASQPCPVPLTVSSAPCPGHSQCRTGTLSLTLQYHLGTLL